MSIKYSFIIEGARVTYRANPGNPDERWLGILNRTECNWDLDNGVVAGPYIPTRVVRGKPIALVRFRHKHSNDLILWSCYYHQLFPQEGPW